MSQWMNSLLVGQMGNNFLSLQGVLITFALQRYRMGVQDFTHSYIDPAPDPATPYSSYPNVSHESYQQPPFTHMREDSEGYQPPPVY